MGEDNPKTTCCAFGCKRWTRRLRAGSEYLCPDHWAMVPARMKRVYRARLRKLARYDDPKDKIRAAALWERMKAHVARNVGF